MLRDAEPLPSVRNLRKQLTGEPEEIFRGKLGWLAESSTMLLAFIAVWMLVTFVLNRAFRVHIPLWLIVSTYIWILITLILQMVYMCWQLVSLFTALYKTSLLDQFIAKEQQLTSALRVHPAKLLGDLEQRLLIELEMAKYMSELLPAIGAALGVLLAFVVASKSSAPFGPILQPHVLLSQICELVLLSFIIGCIIGSLVTVVNKRVLRRLAWILQKASETR